jgi:hypothetical protein
MIKKRKLGDLIKQETQRNEPEPEPVPEPELEQETQPKYLTLVRKETRLREDQLEQLTILTRKLNRQRRGGERLTENTLIRVAIDLLLNKSGELRGATEAELLEALGLEAKE